MMIWVVIEIKVVTEFAFSFDDVLGLILRDEVVLLFTSAILMLMVVVVAVFVVRVQVR